MLECNRMAAQRADACAVPDRLGQACPQRSEVMAPQPRPCLLRALAARSEHAPHRRCFASTPVVEYAKLERLARPQQLPQGSRRTAEPQSQAVDTLRPLSQRIENAELDASVDGM